MNKTAIIPILIAFSLQIQGQSPAVEAEWTSLLQRENFINKARVHEISLAGTRVSPREEVRIVKGGSFTDEGWKSTDTLCQVMMVLKRGFYHTEAGAVEIEMSGLNPMVQQNGRKHHFFSLYASPEGSTWSRYFLDKNRKEVVGGSPGLPFFNLRFGNYGKAEGGRGIKVLWLGGDKRHEKSPFGVLSDWDEEQVYTYRAEWDTDYLAIYLNNELIFGPVEFGERDPDAPMKYIFISRDGHDNPAVWYGMPGPVYRKVRLYYPPGS